MPPVPVASVWPDEVRQAVARAIAEEGGFETWDGLHLATRRSYLTRADAALAALPPVEPTTVTDRLRAEVEAWREHSERYAEEIGVLNVILAERAADLARLRAADGEAVAWQISSRADSKWLAYRSEEPTDLPATEDRVVTPLSPTAALAASRAETAEVRQERDALSGRLVVQNHRTLNAHIEGDRLRAENRRLRDELDAARADRDRQRERGNMAWLEVGAEQDRTVVFHQEAERLRDRVAELEARTLRP